MSDYHIKAVFHSELTNEAIDYNKKRARAEISECIIVEAMALSPATVVVKETMTNNRIIPGEQQYRVDVDIKKSEEDNLRCALEKACDHLIDTTFNCVPVSGSYAGSVCIFCTSPKKKQKECWMQYFMELAEKEDENGKKER